MIRRKLYKLMIFLLAAMILCGLSSAGNVTREISAASEPSEFDVTLILHNLTICGIAETFPPGVTYLGTTHPADQVRVSGTGVAFAVINETEITYYMRSSGQPDDITGVWIDLLNNESGMIGGGEIGTPDNEPAQAIPAQHNTPGFMAAVLTLAVLAAYTLRRR